MQAAGSRLQTISWPHTLLRQGSVDILAQPGLDDALHLFAAQTLRSKACRQLGQLGPEGYSWLREQAVRLAQQAQTPVLQRYFCLTLVALVVQWDDWTDALAFLREHKAARQLPARLSLLQVERCLCRCAPAAGQVPAGAAQPPGRVPGAALHSAL